MEVWKIMTRKNIGLKGFRKTDSISQYVIKELARRYAIRRNMLSRLALHYFGENPSEKEKNTAYGAVRNILYILSRKDLVFQEEKRLVVNVPRLLFLYYINLPKEERKPEKMWSNNRAVNYSALYFASKPLSSIEVGLSEEESINIANTIVRRYYVNDTIYHGYLHTLYTFLKHMSKFLKEINKEENQLYLTKKVEEIIYGHLLDIVSDRKTREIIEEIRYTIQEIVGSKLFKNLMDSWSFLTTKIHGLTDDPDPRTRSRARSFMEVVVEAEIASILTF